SLQAHPDTKMYVSNHFDDDNITMLEDGYDMMGSSGFESGSIAPRLALEHAMSIKADVVLVYSKYAAKQSPFSKLDMIKEAAKTTGEVDAESMEVEEVYKYYASFWAKLPMPLLGLHVIKLKHKDKNSGAFVEDDGLKVLAVIKGSTAFKAGLKRGDVLLSIAGTSVQTPAKLSQAVVKNKGKEVEITYTRDDVSATAQAMLRAQ
ncbi:MAG: PDZ domain-containing protein, partial [Methylophilaceae bacterium]|nr:PDZ domain-containing protein [Methylophilaceae bacterium]